MRRRVLNTPDNGLKYCSVQSGKYDVGNIVFYDSNNDGIIVVDINRVELPLEIARYIPIAVIVIPSAHDVYGTGEAGAISLVTMDTNNPDNGIANISMVYYGYYGKDFSQLNNFSAVNTLKSGELTTTVNPFLPSDYFSGTIQSEEDPKSQYYSGASSNFLAPSPYLGNNRNPKYYSTEISPANALSDFNGKNNTDIILTYATSQANWKTAASITNSSNSGYYPAACCCWRFHTNGTNQGDWYLPACGELGYMMVRLSEINNSINFIINEYGKCAYPINTSNNHGTSTKVSNSYIRVIASSGQVASAKINTYPQTRAFTRFK